MFIRLEMAVEQQVDDKKTALMWVSALVNCDTIFSVVPLKENQARLNFINGSYAKVNHTKEEVALLMGLTPIKTKAKAATKAKAKKKVKKQPVKTLKKAS